MDHPFDLTRPLTRDEELSLGVRPGMVEIGRWITDFPPIAKTCYLLCSKSAAPLNGWTNGMQWCVFASSASFRVYSGGKRFVFFIAPGPDNSPVLAIYADKDFYATVLLFIEEIEKSVAEQAARFRDIRANLTAFSNAQQELVAQNYPRWSNTMSRDVKDDPMVIELDKRYRAEYEEVRDRTQAIMRRSLLIHARTRGARYISISRSLFCVLEGVRTDGLASKPVAHQIGEDLNITAATHEAYGVKTMNLLSLLGDDATGIWFVDTDEPVKVHPHPIPEYGDANDHIERVRGDRDLGEWLESCGAKKMTSRW